MNQKRNEGITLIALVITIIVLLILAGVTISMVLGDDGIIAQAQGAKNAQENAEEKDAIAVKAAEAGTSEYMSGMTKEEVATKTTFNGISQIENATNGSIREIKVVKRGGSDPSIAEEKVAIPIPKGMSYLEGNTLEEGIVVVDKYQNEFVWVPVDNSILPMFINNGDGTYVGKLYDWVNWTGEGNPEEIIGNSYYEPSGAFLDTTIVPLGTIESEYYEMAKSVEKYGGFYVGRYETSWTGTKVASKKNVQPMTGTTVIDGEKTNWYTFYLKQKELYKNNSSLASGMIYGSQFNAIINWLKDITNKNNAEEKYVLNSAGMNYSCYELCTVCEGEGNCDICNGSGYIQTTAEIGATVTGSNLNYAVKNIYDLAGNLLEWSQERYLLNRVSYGTGWGYYDSTSSVINKTTDHPDKLDDDVSLHGSRLQVYIK